MPSNPGLTLKEHQLRIAEKLKTQRGLIIDHGLGSGKTLTAINAAEGYGGAVVVTPASLRENFKKEILKSRAKGKYEIYSYDEFVKKKPDLKGRMLIVDEAHNLRNASTQRTQALLEASKGAEKVLALTATPIQNHPHEIAPLVNLVSGEHTLPTSESAFNKHYIKNKTVVPNLFDRVFRRVPIYKTKEPKNLEEFNQRTAKYVDYYAPTKEGYPSVVEQTIEVPMAKSQIDAHRYWSRKLDPATRRKIANNLPVSEKEASRLNEFVNAQRQISNTSTKFTKTEDSTASPKVKAAIDRIKTADGPAVIYSNYIGSGVDPLNKELTKEGISHRSFTGGMNDKEKKETVEAYNKGKVKALVISSTGGEGLDLKKTSQIHILEPHWNEEKINQVVGRAVRYKSHEGLPEDKQTVNVYKYVSSIPHSSEKTADQYLTELSRKKKDLNDKFLGAWR
jgi:SNF2 family DNA or RNA helicase